jgi:hypothetical protein
VIPENHFRIEQMDAVLDDPAKKQSKVDYLATSHLRMRKNIIAHNCFIDETTVEQLREMTFVFACIDKGVGKQLIVERLEEWGLPFIDVGMGIQLGDDNTLGGVLTLTTRKATVTLIKSRKYIRTPNR